MFNGNANGAPVGPRIPAAVAATGSAERRKWTSKCRNLASFLLEIWLPAAAVFWILL